MELNQNKKDQILNLPSCSKDLLIWIQLQAIQEDIIEITYKHYTKGVKVSLNTFKKALGGLLDLKVLFATSKKGKFKLNYKFFAPVLFVNSTKEMWLKDSSRIPILEYENKNIHSVTLDYFKQKIQERKDLMVDPNYINKLNLKLQEEESKLK